MRKHWVGMWAAVSVDDKNRGIPKRHDFRKKAFYNSYPQKELLKTSKKTLAPRLALIKNFTSKGNT